MVSREDPVLLGFGYFQLCCFSSRPGWITLRRVTVRSQLGHVKEKRPVHDRVTLNCALS